ncbi:MAG TPA: head GIN domain-containing protein [Flavisolibacter sp.]|jgi:hypothetical protein|nr:head GIN domain-containing protein [Flavisolibacter sp.]
MRTIFLFILTLAILSSCNFLGGKKVSGNGTIVSRDISAGSFENIEASGAITVYLRQNATSSVKIETDENLMEFVEVVVDGNTLRIRPKKGYNLDPSKEVIVYAWAPGFREVGISGASKLLSQGTLTGNNLQLDASGASEIQLDVDLPKIDANLSGASTLRLKGRAEDFSTEASGASKILCMDLSAEKATLDLSGASNAKITANKELVIDASGASDVEYRGNADVDQKSSGASSVKKV